MSTSLVLDSCQAMHSLHLISSLQQLLKIRIIITLILQRKKLNLGLDLRSPN